MPPLDQSIDRLTQEGRQTKAALINGGGRYSNAAILAGADYDSSGATKAYSFLQAVADARRGDSEANNFVKAELGTSVATGLAVVPNSFVSGLVAQVAAISPWRNLIPFTASAAGVGVDIPYEITGISAALLQGAYGSNKDIRDFSFARATATLYTIAQIADVGNQLLRQSAGAAEASVRGRLAKSFAVTEDQFIVSGTGSSQPLGILPALLAFGDVAAFKTTLTSEPRLATIGRALGALEGRGQVANAVILNPATYWTMAVEGLGTSYAGGWAADPVGAASGAPQPAAWGVPIYRSAALPAGTGLAGDFSTMAVYTGGPMTIDVSGEAGSRWDSDLTGFRAEIEFGYNAEPYVRTGQIQKILGL
jgi:HK97 family phage major capsid protein